MKDKSAEAILKLPEVHYKLDGEFTGYRLFTTSIPFHAAVTRNNYETFNKALKTVTIKNKNKVKVMEANRNINNSFLSFTNKSGKSINFEVALKYPLKAKLKKIIYKNGEAKEDVVLGRGKDGYALDMIETFEGLFIYYLIVFFLLVDANHYFLRSKE